MTKVTKMEMEKTTRATGTDGAVRAAEAVEQNQVVATKAQTRKAKAAVSRRTEENQAAQERSMNSS
jgi:hypothetical protein